jgi:capsular exopolysaccharide synthesis family protein
LALSAARFHQRVLLIDADLRRPTLHQMLNLPNEQGLSTLLSNDATLPSHSSIQSSGAAIDILPAGPTPADPVNLLSSQRMRELMAEFEKNYDLILLDASPVLGMVDAIIAASLCSGVVLVSRIGQVTKTELAQATAILSKLNVIGVVANGVKNTNYGYATYYRENKVVSNQVWES